MARTNELVLSPVVHHRAREMGAYLRVSDELAFGRLHCDARVLVGGITEEQRAFLVEHRGGADVALFVGSAVESVGRGGSDPRSPSENCRAERQELHHLATADVVVTLPLNGEIRAPLGRFRTTVAVLRLPQVYLLVAELFFGIFHYASSSMRA